MFKILVLLLGILVMEADASDESSREREERCYEKLGCLVLDEQWWDPWRRPLNLWPQDPSVIDTSFIFYVAGRTHKESQVIHINSTSELQLTSSMLDSSKPTKVIIHGYREDLHATWVNELTEVLLQYGDCNVIVVNWGGGSGGLYAQAVGNARLVGLQTAYLLNSMVASCHLSLTSVHIIGHALGAHIAGYVGEGVPGMGRITGLSPSAFYFEELPQVVRLDEGDAIFVDVVHTDTNGHGSSQLCGTVDFFPNGGGEQPGCGIRSREVEFTTGNNNYLKFSQSCSGLRAVDLFVASLTEPDSFLGHQCSDHYRYASGQCYSCGEESSHCGYLGLMAEKFPAEGRNQVPLHFITSASSPFRVHSYLVSLNLAHPEEAEDCVEGYLFLTLKGKNSSLSTTIPGDRVLLNHGQPRGWVLGLKEDLGSVEEVMVEWDFDSSLFSKCFHQDSNTNLYIHTLKVSPIDYLPESKREENTRLLCEGLESTEVASGSYAILKAKETCQEWSL